MILDTDIFKEVVAAIGVETSLSVIAMFQEQSLVLLAGAANTDFPPLDRAESLHALKGMAMQLGLMDLGHGCLAAHDAIQNNCPEDELSPLISGLNDTLSQALNALLQEKRLLLA